MNFIIKTFPTETGKLYFCRCPMGKSELKEIADLKIDCIFNLAKELESIIDIEKTVCDNVIAGGIEDYNIPDDINVFYAQIEYVSELLRKDKKVLVHCMGGHGRSSLALCCISLALKQYSLEETFKIAKELARGPETEKQIQFVKRFNEFIAAI